MALNAILTQEEWDALPEVIQKEYASRDGRYFLDVVEVDGFKLDNPGKLKSALERERKSARDAQAKLKVFEGIEDPERALEALQKLDDMANWDPDKEVAEKVQAKIDQLKNAHGKDRKKLENELADYEKQLREVLVDAALTEALTKSGALSAKVLKGSLKPFIRMAKGDDGKFKPQIIDPDTGIERIADADGSPMTIPQFVESLKGDSEYKPFFAGNGSTGAGIGSGGSRPAATATSTAVRTIPRSAMADHIDEIVEGKVQVDLSS